jgi:HK97 family phage major capsid protein
MPQIVKAHMGQIRSLEHLFVNNVNFLWHDDLAAITGEDEAARELTPDWCVLHPNDLWALRLTKDGFGRYILGDPSHAGDVPSLWGMKLVATTSISSGSFLMGSSSPIASEIRDRMSLVVEISTSHADFFVKTCAT